MPSNYEFLENKEKEISSILQNYLANEDTAKYVNYDLNKLVRLYVIKKAELSNGSMDASVIGFREALGTRFEQLLLDKIKELPNLTDYLNDSTINMELLWDNNMKQVDGGIDSLDVSINSKEKAQEFLSHDFVGDILPSRVIVPDVHHDFNLTDEDIKAYLNNSVKAPEDDEAPGMGGR